MTEGEGEVSTRMKVGSKLQLRWLSKVIWLVFVLNVFDALLTVYWVLAVGVEEGNPVMRALVGLHPAFFVAGKLSLVIAGSWVLWRWRRRRVAVVGIFGLFIVYYWILLYHLHWLKALGN